MKLRTILLIALLLPGLNAFSLVEDLALVPEAISWGTTIDTDLTATPPATPPAGNEPAETQEPIVGSVSGVVLSGAGATLPSDLNVTLRGFDMPEDMGSDVIESITILAAVNPDGTYLFENIEIIPGRIFLAEVSVDGVPYQSNYAIAEQASLVLPDLTVYPASSDPRVLAIEQVHIGLDYSVEGIVRIANMIVLTNDSTTTVTVASDDSSIPFVLLPEYAENIRYQVASGSSPFIGLMTGFALKPLEGGQRYALSGVYELPYERTITLEQSFTLPVKSVLFFVPEGVKASGERLSDKGLRDLNGTTVQEYELTDLEAGEPIAVKLSGQPKSSVGLASSKRLTSVQKWVITGMGAAGIVLIGVGSFLLFRDRKKQAGKPFDDEVDESDDPDAAALPNDRDAILDAIIALDDQFRGKEISRQVYEKRRSELKDQFKRLA